MFAEKSTIQTVDLDDSQGLCHGIVESFNDSYSKPKESKDSEKQMK
jgi:hypothetical protein